VGKRALRLVGRRPREEEKCPPLLSSKRSDSSHGIVAGESRAARVVGRCDECDGCECGHHGVRLRLGLGLGLGLWDAASAAAPDSKDAHQAEKSAGQQH
jgi:hypothetical protein